MKKDTIRVGDRVRIVNPEFFIRCGYENNHQDAMKQIREEYGEKILRFIYDWEASLHSVPSADSKISLSLISFDQYRTELRNPHSYDRIISALAYDLVARNKKSGAERKIFTERLERYKDDIFTVSGAFMCMTGFYYPAGGRYDSYTGEYDYEPGGLDKMKAHRILELREFVFFEIGRERRRESDSATAIEECHIERVIQEDM
jgi:hypothetical protein